MTKHQSNKHINFIYLLIIISLVISSCSSINGLTNPQSVPSAVVGEIAVDSVTVDAELTATDPVGLGIFKNGDIVAEDEPLINWKKFTVSSVDASVGDQVKEGDVLATIHVPSDFKEVIITKNYYGSDRSLMLTRTKQEYLDSHTDLFENSAEMALKYFRERAEETSDYYTSITTPRATEADLTLMRNEMENLDWDILRLIKSGNNYVDCDSYGRFTNNPFHFEYYYDSCYFNIYRTGDGKRFSAMVSQKDDFSSRYVYLSATFTEEQIYQAKVKKITAKEDLDQAQLIYDQIMEGDYSTIFFTTSNWDNYYQYSTTGWWMKNNEELATYEELDELISEFTIRAPFDGVILNVNIEAGQQIPSAGLGNAFQIVDPSNMRLVAKIPQEIAANIDLSADAIASNPVRAGTFNVSGLILNPVAKKLPTASLLTQYGSLNLVSEPDVVFELSMDIDTQTSMPLIGSTYQVELPLLSPIMTLTVPQNAIRRDGQSQFVTVKGPENDFDVPINILETYPDGNVLISPVRAGALMVGDILKPVDQP